MGNGNAGKTVAIIPARGGSKGIPRKNIRLLAGKPLIGHTIEAALRSGYISRVIVSTEDKEIADVARKYGAEVVRRPEELAKDDTSTVDVVLQVIRELREQGHEYDTIILLQPTSPMRTTQDVDGALELFLNNECESVISVSESRHPPYWAFNVEGNYLKPLFDQKYSEMRRQDLPKTYFPNGAIYIAKTKKFEECASFCLPQTIPYIMPAETSVDIDTKADLMLAEALLKKKDDKI